MDRRRKRRVTISLPVRVWGLDANSRPFIELASVKNISEQGILLNGLACPLRTGTVVDVQYNGVRAEFLVIWIAASGTSGEIGLQRLSSHHRLWDHFLDRTNGIAANG
jgi:hypothetical protein